MNTIPKRRPINRFIAMLLVLSMTFVYVVGDNYAPLTIDQNKLYSNDALAQTLSYNTGLTDQTDLMDVSELVLAKNTTVMGKTSETLSENQAELDDAVATFNEQINALKATANKELSDTDNETDELNEYKEAVISGFNDLEFLLSDISVENYEAVMSDISALINPEKPYVSLADDLPFNEVSEDNITYFDYNPNL